MANICEQRIVITADTDSDMAELLEKLARNIVGGPAHEDYFSYADVDKASGDMHKLYEMLRETPHMNKLCLFSSTPDSSAESGWMPYELEYHNGHPTFIVEIGVKWSESANPGRFCCELDAARYGYSISSGGEVDDWESLNIDGDYILAEEISEKVDKARRALSRSKKLSAIAHNANLAGIDTSYYTCDWE